jgi:hypothetical protein
MSDGTKAVRRRGGSLFDAATSYLVKELAPDRFWQVLKQVSQKKLVNILGPDLRAQGRGCAVDVGTRTASLGCLVPSAPPQIEIDAYDKVRMHLTDGAFTVYLSVTDLRFYQQGQKTAGEDRAGCSTENRQGGGCDPQRGAGQGVAEAWGHCSPALAGG